MKQVKILNVPIDNLSKLELLAKLRAGGIVFTTNVDHLMKLQNDQDFYQAYMVATYRVCDSQIIKYAANFLNTPIQEKISGSDFFPAFCKYYQNDEEIKVFLLGSAEGVATQAKKNINKKVGRKIVVGAYSPSFSFENSEAESQKIIDLINQSGATVLAIGVSAPKQEVWLRRYYHRCKQIRIFMGIGATIDFEAGCCQRAPKWMRDIGLEWFHRLMSAPRRLWKRYLVEDIPFFWLLLLQKFNLYQNPFTEELKTSILPPDTGQYAVVRKRIIAKR